MMSVNGLTIALQCRWWIRSKAPPVTDAATHRESNNFERRKYGFAVALALLGLAAGLANAGDAFSENEIKAVFLYNFANFVIWPKDSKHDAAKEFHYCVLDEAIMPVLQKVLKGETVRGQPLSVRPEINDANLADCHVLYLSKDRFDGPDGWKLVRAALSAQVLTVSDLENFEVKGGMIALVRQDRRIRPRINIDAVEKAGLRVSAKLLNLATVVRDDGADMKR
ncbi:MAG: YfiR family protein [Candidatus Competibacteraceae bacterium]|nr:YfiR family protein [Candidatus Competibacteraceae bacterium]